MWETKSKLPICYSLGITAIEVGFHLSCSMSHNYYQKYRAIHFSENRTDAFSRGILLSPLMRHFSAVIVTLRVIKLHYDSITSNSVELMTSIMKDLNSLISLKGVFLHLRLRLRKDLLHLSTGPMCPFLKFLGEIFVKEGPRGRSIQKGV